MCVHSIEHAAQLELILFVTININFDITIIIDFSTSSPAICVHSVPLSMSTLINDKTQKIFFFFVLAAYINKTFCVDNLLVEIFFEQKSENFRVCLC